MYIHDTKITPAEFMGSHEAVDIAKTLRGEQTAGIFRYLVRLAVRGYSRLASHGANINAAYRHTGHSGYPYI